MGAKFRAAHTFAKCQSGSLDSLTGLVQAHDRQDIELLTVPSTETLQGDAATARMDSLQHR